MDLGLSTQAEEALEILEQRSDIFRAILQEEQSSTRYKTNYVGNRWESVRPTRYQGLFNRGQMLRAWIRVAVE